MSAGAVDALPLWYLCGYCSYSSMYCMGDLYGYHVVLKCLGICADSIHISLCIVWVLSVLVLLDVISWVRVPVLVYVLKGCLCLGCQFAWDICIVGVHISLCIVWIVIMLVSLSRQGILSGSISISICIVLVFAAGCAEHLLWYLYWQFLY